VDAVGQVTASMGVATWPQDGATEERLVWVSDQRLYAAKESGRNKVCSAVMEGVSADNGTDHDED
jgi:GGDEF domain-containing protein